MIECDRRTVRAPYAENLYESKRTEEITVMNNLIQQLESPDFYKKVYPGIFSKGKRKDAMETWTAATEKGVADTVLLRQAAHGSFTYNVFAFSVNGDIAPEVQTELKNILAEFDTNQIRYEAVGVPGFFAVYDKDGNFFQNDYEIMPLCRKYDGIYIVIVSETEKDELDCPYAAYTFNPDGSLWFWCVARKYL